MSESYRDLIAWQKAMALVTRVYEVTEPFPHREIFGLTRQVRDAALSVPSNIAEGQGRGSPQEFKHFISIAMGSLTEIETQILIAQRLSYISEAEWTRSYKEQMRSVACSEACTKQSSSLVEVAADRERGKVVLATRY